MYIIFNKDGSVMRTNFSDYIMQHSNLVNKIFVAIVNSEIENWSCEGFFNLPNESTTVQAGIPAKFLFEGVNYQGWEITLTNEETKYDGKVSLTINLTNPELTEVQGKTLFTYAVELTINRTGVPLDGSWDNCINYAEHNSFMALLATKFGLGTTQVVVEEEPEQPSLNVVYWFKDKTENGEIIPNSYTIKMWNGSEYTIVGRVNADFSQYIRQTEKGQPNGVAPLDENGKVLNKYLYGDLPQVIKGRINEEKTVFTDLNGQVVEGQDNKLYLDVDTNDEYIYNEVKGVYVLQSAQIAEAVNVKFSPVDDLTAENVQALGAELNYKKVDIKPLTWTTLPEGAVDKKTFYNKTIATLRTATNKIYMYGTPEETPIKEFFTIWGKPTDFKATYVYITIASISNETKRDSFAMIIHSSNYSNMYFYIANGYSSQLVGNGSGWISANLLSAEKQKQLAKIDGYYQSMRVGNADIADVAKDLASVERPYENQEFITRETANGDALAVEGDEGVSVAELTELKGNTIVANQLLVPLDQWTGRTKEYDIKIVNGLATIVYTTNSTQEIIIYSGGEALENHVYYVLAKVKPSKETKVYFRLQNYTNKVCPENIWTDFDYLEKTTKYNSRYLLQFNPSTTTYLTGDKIEVKDLYTVDLTQMFGITETSQATPEMLQFVKNYLEKHPEYTEGTLVSATPTKLVSYGANLCDNVFIQEDSQNIKSGNFVKVPDNCDLTFHAYGFTCDSLIVYTFDKDKQPIGVIESYGFQNNVLAIPSGVAYIKIDYQNGDKPLPLPDNPQVMVNIGNNPLPYVEYVAPNEVDLKLQAELKSAGAIYDSQTPTQYIKRVGVVDLGTLPWQISDEATHRFSAQIDTLKSYNRYSGIDNLICSKYVNYPRSELFDIPETIGVASQSKKLFIKDNSLTISNIATALSGVILQYELATPIITPIVETAVIDLGDLEYNYSNPDKRFYSVSLKNLANPNGIIRVSSTFQVDIGALGTKDKCITLYDGYLYLTDFSQTDPNAFKDSVKGIKLTYEVAEPTNPSIKLDYDYKAYNHGIEEFEGTDIPAVADITYNISLKNKLINVKPRSEQQALDDRQDREIKDLQNVTIVNSTEIGNIEIAMEVLPKREQVRLKYNYRGNIYDIDLYNQLLSVDEIMNGALFSIEITNDTPIEQIRKGYPKLTQGAIVYGWLSTDELGQPMIIHTEQGTYKIIDGGTLTCEKISGLMTSTINYSVVNDMKVQLDQATINDYYKGLKVSLDIDVDGVIVNTTKTIEFNPKSTATIYVGGQILDERRSAKPIFVRYVKATGIVDVYSENNIPSGSYKIIDVKGLI